jgi:hypothetical protein
MTEGVKGMQEKRADIFGQGFGQVLSDILRKVPAKVLAKELGISVWTLYKYAEGVRAFPADLVASLYLATGDKRIIQYILKGTGLKIRDG